MARMDHDVAEIAKGMAPERVWLLEHPPLYTAGTSASENDLLNGTRFPVFQPAAEDNLPIMAPDSGLPM